MFLKMRLVIDFRKSNKSKNDDLKCCCSFVRFMIRIFIKMKRYFYVDINLLNKKRKEKFFSNKTDLFLLFEQILLNTYPFQVYHQTIVVLHLQLK